MDPPTLVSKNDSEMSATNPRFYPMERIPYELLEKILRCIREQEDMLNWLRAFDLDRNKYRNFKDMYLLLDLVEVEGLECVWPVLYPEPLDDPAINLVVQVSHLLERIELHEFKGLSTLSRMKGLSRKPIVSIYYGCNTGYYYSPEKTRAFFRELGAATRLNELFVDENA